MAASLPLLTHKPPRQQDKSHNCNKSPKNSLPAAFIVFPCRKKHHDVFIDIEWLHGQKYAMTFDHKYATAAGMNGGKRIYFKPINI